MRPQEFLYGVRDRAAAALPDELRDFHSKVVYATLQLHYGNPSAHYEVWLVRKTGRIEVGLHFEGEREDNAAAAAALADHVHELRERAGADVELEQWTASWTRLHVTLPLGALTESLCDETARRLAGLIAATRPLVEPRLLSAGRRSSGERRFRRNRHGRAGASR